MALNIFNTLSRKKEEFIPLKRNFAQIYVCGLTVYDFMHIGHARTYLFWDVLRRYLDFKGYDVLVVINNTDIEDKIIARSNELKIDFRLLADFYTEAFYSDLKTLGALPYCITCNATDYIPEMIETIELILKNGFGYEIDGDVFYSVEKFSDYGKLSGFSVDELVAGARVEVNERKRHPADFTLWKSAKPGEPSWDSPWGKGRPGWHIECSTMAYHFFGGTYDIKGGGIDNLFPHHENEIAQTFAAYGIPLAKYFMHPEHLLVDGAKMSKSLGNFITVRELLKDWKPAEVRLYFLQTHYRTQMNFTKEGMNASREALERISHFRSVVLNALKGEKEIGLDIKSLSLLKNDAPIMNLLRKTKESFISAMDDDFNTPRALATLFDFISESYKIGIDGSQDSEELRYAFNEFDRLMSILGLESDLLLTKATFNWENDFSKLVDILLKHRAEARMRRDFKTADLIREMLNQAGLVLEDTASGTRWIIREESR